MKPLIIFGPSGVGKGTIIKSLQSRNPNLFKLTLSYTTRLPRQGQIPGYHYNFISKQQFSQKIKQNQMLEHKVVFDNMYGTCRKNVEEILCEGKIPVMDVDVEGMLDIQKCIADEIGERERKNEEVKIGKPLCLCILPPSFGLLRERLKGRKTESEEVVEKRMRENVKQIQRMIAVQDMGIENLFYATNYQYQSTIYGIQRWLQRYHREFAVFRKAQFAELTQSLQTS